MIWDVHDYTWQRNYTAALEYYRKHGSLKMPKVYVTEDGIRLYLWLRNMRAAYCRKDKGYQLSSGQIQKLSELGVEWENKHHVAWNRGYDYAKDYFDTNGNLDVPASYKTSDGYKLGDWITNQREKYATGTMKPERIEALRQIGMIWEKPDSWDERFKLAEAYYLQHGNLEMPSHYTVNGIWLSKWIDEQRQIYNGNRKGKALTDEQIRRLDSIGMRWVKLEEIQWQEQYSDVQRYLEAHGNVNIPQSYKSPNGKLTGLWLQRQRKKLREGKLSLKQIQLLRAVGV